jgi:hypothetical protein
MAARDAVVTSERAVIWADIQRTAPLGYARRGKVLRVGEKELSKGQVVGVIVSGKLAYVSIDDIALEDELNKEEDRKLETTRFRDATETKYSQYISAYYLAVSAQESKNTGAARPGDDWSFQGGGMKGGVQRSDSRFGLAIMIDYIYAENTKPVQDETFRMFRMGMGPSFALLNFNRMFLRLETLFVLVPWAQYEAAPLFTLNGYGGGVIGQGTLLISPFGKWGLEVSAGLEALKLFNIRRPAPFKEFDPAFVGGRVSAGVAYRF